MEKIYGRRKGRPLSSQRQDLMETLLPQLRIEVPAQGQISETLISTNQRIWLEIGFGRGEHLIAQSQKHPDVLMIGCDAFENAVGCLVNQIAQQGISNIRVFDDDARKLVSALPTSCLDRVFILFPDPWPKARHHKRRIMNPGFLQIIARVLKPGGVLRFASDIPDYIDQVLDLVAQQEAFAAPAGTRVQWQQPPADWVSTKYEKRGQRLGHVCHYLDFLKRHDVNLA